MSVQAVMARSETHAFETTDRIEKIEITLFSYPMENVARGGIDCPGAISERRRLAVQIWTAGGAVGAYVGGQANSLAQSVLCARGLLGKDAFAREYIYEQIRQHLRKEDRMGAGAIDCALWDLAGRAHGLSVAEMLGGTKTKVKAYASTWFGGDGGGLSSPGAYADFAEECHELGYQAFKIHGWTDGGTERDIAAIRLLGERVGEKMALMHDAACFFRTFADALAIGRACDDAEFFWFEDPYSDGGLSAHAHRRLREMVKTPLLIGEHLRGLELHANLVLSDGTDFVRADPDFDMGITGTMKLARFAEAMGLDVELHAPGPAHRHCMAAIRNTNFYELSMVGPSKGSFNAPVYACGYSDDLDAVASDGTFPVPEGPGLGVTYDWERIHALAVETVVIQ
ncbi:enolase C-terminal domain-like protein [Hoeflea prorocentri]|uniref:glucarate dehydratase n=1 Tax=Hoeflea prorocentri TaxID=1922333 RepID=A0A9X3UJF3_9HYPH|nr:enolase C-terminal domain-like protein [Hoeflea prorocentri]MCY6381910.1 mandelate racemase [Hoeflea prorocentri]MDA5399710.1 mandelate racemase [Hoeflea prorocentri]